MTRPTLLLLVIVLLRGPAQGQAGSLDLSFNPDDAGHGFGDAPNGDVRVSLLCDNDALLIAGSFDHVHGTMRPGLARLDADGILDPSFDPGIGFDGAVNSLVLQPDGRILVGGAFTTYDGVVRNRIARLNADGSLDLTFDPGSGFDASVSSITILPDGDVYAGGGFSWFNGNPVNRLARLNDDGTWDPGFSSGVLLPGYAGISDLALQPDGRLIATGPFQSVDGVLRRGIARFMDDGGLDPTFDTGPLTSVSAGVLTLQPDGRVLLGGAPGVVVHGLAPMFCIARLNADGTFDSSFGTLGSGFSGPPLTPSVHDIVLQPDGKLLVSGYFGSYQGIPCKNMARLNSDGILDAGFDPESFGSVALLASGKIICEGSVRLDPDGSRDPAYYPGSGLQGVVRTMRVQADGRILIGGTLDRYDGQETGPLARLLPDGSLDPSFSANDPSISLANAEQPDMVLRPDGRVIVAGTGLSQLNTDGSIDPSFDDGDGPNSMSGGFRRLALQPDGKVLLVGDFTTYDGTTRLGIARLDPDGALDATFDPNTTISEGVVHVVALQPDGRIIIGGLFSCFDGAAVGRIMRLNADGTADATFTTAFLSPAGTYGYPWAIDLQADGKMVVGGMFTAVNGLARYGIVRLNTDGSVDTGFDPGGGLDANRVEAIAVQDDGKVILGGGFALFNGVFARGIVRLNTDGSVDPSFMIGTGFGSYVTAFDNVRTIRLQADGRVLVGGRFTAYDGTGRNRIARLNNELAASTASLAAQDISISPNPSSGAFTVQGVSAGTFQFKISDLSGRMVEQGSFPAAGEWRMVVDLFDQRDGVYLLRIESPEGVRTDRLVKN